MGWSDVGSWDALWEIQEKSAEGNVTEGDVMTERVRNTYIKAETRMVAALGAGRSGDRRDGGRRVWSRAATTPHRT